MERPENTGVEYPIVIWDQQPLTVRCSFYAEYQLSRAGLTLGACLEVLTSLRRTGVQDPHAVNSAMEMWAACVAENYQDQLAPTADQWAKKLSRLDDWGARWKEMCGAVDSALSKRFPAATPPAAQPGQVPALTN